MNLNTVIVIFCVLVAFKLLSKVGKGIDTVTDKIGLDKGAGAKGIENKNYLRAGAISEIIKRNPKVAVKLSPSKKIATDAKQIFNSLGNFTIDNDSRVVGIFETYEFKTQVAQLSEYFYKTYNRSLVDFLTEFLSSGSMDRILQLLDRMKTGV